jgi:hypothetical protein
LPIRTGTLVTPPGLSLLPPIGLIRLTLPAPVVAAAGQSAAVLMVVFQIHPSPTHVAQSLFAGSLLAGGLPWQSQEEAKEKYPHNWANKTKTKIFKKSFIDF